MKTLLKFLKYRVHFLLTIYNGVNWLKVNINMGDEVVNNKKKRKA